MIYFFECSTQLLTKFTDAKCRDERPKYYDEHQNFVRRIAWTLTAKEEKNYQFISIDPEIILKKLHHFHG